MRIDRSFTRRALSAQEGKTHMKVTLTPPEPTETPKPLCVVLAIDHSDEMAEPDRTYGYTETYTSRISQVRRGAFRLVEELRDEDLFGCAVFNHECRICQHLIHPVSARVPDIKLQISRIEARGGRRLSGGLAQAERFFTDKVLENYRCQIILVTCGDTMISVRKMEDLSDQCNRLRTRGVAVNLVGCGKRYSLKTFTDMIRAGGGRAHQVEDFSEFPDILRREVADARAVSAEDARFIIRTEPFVEIGENLSGYPQKSRPGQAELSLGNLHAPVSLYFEIGCFAPREPFAEMEIVSVYGGLNGKVEKKMEFETLKILEEEGELAEIPFDQEALAAWVENYSVHSLLELSDCYDKCHLTRMGQELEDAKDWISSLSSLYPGTEAMLARGQKLLTEKSRMFMENRLSVGENKAVYFELMEMLRHNRRKI